MIGPGILCAQAGRGMRQKSVNSRGTGIKYIDNGKEGSKGGIRMARKWLGMLLALFVLTGCSLALPERLTTKEPDGPETPQKAEEEAVEQEKEQEEPAEFDLSIASIGDSLTKGVGDETEKGGYTSYLLDRLEEEEGIDEIEFTHYGKRGLSTEGLLGKLENNTVTPIIENADVIIITIGGNDVMNIAKENYRSLKMEQFTDGIEEYEKNLHAIIRKTREINPDADVYFVGLYNPWRQWFADIEEFGRIMELWNENTQEAAGEYEGVYFVEISPLFEGGDDNLIFEEDYFHPNTKGYQLMGEAVYEAIQKHSLPDE